MKDDWNTIKACGTLFEVQKKIEIEDLYHMYYIIKTQSQVVHLLPEVVLDLKDENIIVLPLNLKKSMG